MKALNSREKPLIAESARAAAFSTGSIVRMSAGKRLRDALLVRQRSGRLRRSHLAVKGEEVGAVGTCGQNDQKLIQERSSNRAQGYVRKTHTHYIDCT